MKGLLGKALVLGGLSLFAFTASFAANTTHMNNKQQQMNANNKQQMKKQMWVCTTNASSSSNPNDQTADNMMSKTAKHGSEAFDFALKHCRDCTKITCSAENRA